MTRTPWQSWAGRRRTGWVAIGLGALATGVGVAIIAGAPDGGDNRFTDTQLTGLGVSLNELLEWRTMQEAAERGLSTYEVVGAGNPRTSARALSALSIATRRISAIWTEPWSGCQLS